MKQNASQLSAMARLFSSAVFRELARTGRSALFRRLLEMTGLTVQSRPGATVCDVFDSAFKLLKVAGLRDEYVYRAALTHKVLMGTHSLRTATMLNEFRAGACKADLVILNGTASVYEIKSERDSLIRLSNQIENYRRVFAAVNVITCRQHLDGVRTVVPKEVGIMCLSNRFQITPVRDAVERFDRICAISVFESLRTTEAAAVLKAFNIAIPEVPNTLRRRAMRELFARLDSAALHKQMVRTLKKSRDLAPLGQLVDNLPESLHAAALSVPIRRADHDRLVRAVRLPLEVAMSWT